MAKTKAHIFVSGIVQGVFFRQTTKRQAQKFGVTGWVRNLPDRRVEAVFEGEQDAVDAVVAFCRKGPSGAHVTEVAVDWALFTGEFEDFKIT